MYARIRNKFDKRYRWYMRDIMPLSSPLLDKIHINSKEIFLENGNERNLNPISINLDKLSPHINFTLTVKNEFKENIQCWIEGEIETREKASRFLGAKKKIVNMIDFVYCMTESCRFPMLAFFVRGQIEGKEDMLHVKSMLVNVHCQNYAQSIPSKYFNLQIILIFKIHTIP
ncbi:hypothetical protein HMI56_001158 [Coelomomyces lativittatus]|nr:hypothetical protein HMI56_001158 [Coelomomyces lativittatus]